MTRGGTATCQFTDVSDAGGLTESCNDIETYVCEDDPNCSVMACMTCSTCAGGCLVPSSSDPNSLGVKCALTEDVSDMDHRKAACMIEGGTLCKAEATERRRD